MSKLKASVVIGTFNQRDTLKKVLLAYNDQTISGNEFEVIVVDSTSTDGTDIMLKELDAKFNFKFFIQENQGKSGARNRAVKESESDLIIITDADMIPHPELIQTHVSAQEKTNQLTCFEGVTLNMETYDWPPKPETLSTYIKKNYKNGAKLGWYCFITGNISIPKSLFNEMNGFDRDFLVYGWEDLELGYRLEKKKIPLIYLKDAKNYHYHILNPKDEVRRCFFKGESAQIFIKKHPELKLFLGLNPLSLLIMKITKENGSVYRFFEKLISSRFNSLNRLGIWFLSEYQYLLGVLDIPSKLASKK